MDSSSTVKNQHPFHPPSLEIPNYTPPAHAADEIAYTVAFMSTAMIIGIQLVLEKIRAKPSMKERVRVGWFGLCVLLHLFEFYVSISHPTPSDLASSTSPISSIMKYYAHGDSRFITLMPPIPALTNLTSFLILPLCIFTLYGILTDDFPKEILGTIATSGMYLSSSVVYFTGATEGQWTVGGRGRWFWMAMVGGHYPWIVMPLWLLWESWVRVERVWRVAGTKTFKGKRRVEW